MLPVLYLRHFVYMPIQIEWFIFFRGRISQIHEVSKQKALMGKLFTTSQRDSNCGCW